MMRVINAHPLPLVTPLQTDEHDIPITHSP
jgi:hypothetical protein